MKTLSTIAFTLLTLSIAQAETFMGETELSKKILDDIIILGPAHLTEIKADSLTVTGTLFFDKLDVSGNVTVVGPIKEDSTDLLCKDLDVLGTIDAKNIKCANINVVGSAKLENIETSGDVKIVGMVEIKSAILQNLHLTANEMQLSDVNIKDITVDKIPLSGDHQTLYLKGDTTVGSVTFKSGKGTIVMENSAKVSGEIKGATVKKEELKK